MRRKPRGQDADFARGNQQTMNIEIQINNRVIGVNHPTYFIADIAANHDGHLDRAIELIEMCAEAGADAAKFQNFSAETIVSDRGFRDLKEGLSHQAKWSESVYEVYKRAELPLEWAAALREACDRVGIDYFTAPYDLEFVSELSEQVVAWKIGSGDITWHELIDKVSRDKKPVFLATGASSFDEVKLAVDIVHGHCGDLVLMQCNTNYTGDLENFRHVSLNRFSDCRTIHLAALVYWVQWRSGPALWKSTLPMMLAALVQIMRFL